MEEIMQSNSYFIIPLTVAYTSICALWFFLNRRGKLWEIESIETSGQPWMDLGLGFLASIGIFGIGQLYSAGYLIPKTGTTLINQLIIWPLNNLLIFSPIFLVLLFRQQNLKTVFIARKQAGLKLAFGLGASALGILLFVALRGEWDRIPEILGDAIKVEKLSNFPAIFFENVALAFLFVRLKWALSTKWAIGIPAILFALAHVPGSVAEGDPWMHIAIFFLLTGSLTTVILYTAYRSRDILWLGLVHFFMDIAIKSF